jgi:hypothetical protein
MTANQDIDIDFSTKTVSSCKDYTVYDERASTKMTARTAERHRVRIPVLSGTSCHEMGWRLLKVSENGKGS